MKINKNNLLCLLIPLFGGFLSGLITSISINYSELIKPPFSPPAYVFPIIWIILYLLMGISCIMINSSNDYQKKRALKTYYLQLFFNLIWSLLFFTFQLKIIAFLDILLLIYLVVQMIIMFYQIKQVAAIIQIPYLIWLLVASYLNICIILLN